MAIQFRAEIDTYTSRVLGVIKERFGLKDKSEALQKLAHLYGEEYVPYELKDEVFNDLVLICKEHTAKYGQKKMSLEELDELCK